VSTDKVCGKQEKNKNLALNISDIKEEIHFEEPCLKINENIRISPTKIQLKVSKVYDNPPRTKELKDFNQIPVDSVNSTIDKIALSDIRSPLCDESFG